ncbi:MAG: NAD(P)/FAD-dependent oxidoreductase [Pseudomonadota bacterium]
MSSESVDVIIVGAGVSGIGAAYYLKTRLPHLRYTVIEARDHIGGTWDLFRYPGIRSDSDMYTFGFKFKPWVYEQAISPGEQIRAYLNDAADEHDIRPHIQFATRVTAASWRSDVARWSVTAESADLGVRSIECRFFFFCGGYYRYAQGHQPAIDGLSDFGGKIIHPQHWPTDYDYADQRVVVVGSGATAVTLVPALAEKAAHVTMLQRSPTYIVAKPSVDPIARFFQRWLPTSLAYGLTRWKNVLASQFLFWFARRFPDLTRRSIKDKARALLPKDYDLDRHLNPDYAPWDQRICLAPDGDLFRTIADQKATIVTDQIRTFTKTGIELVSGGTLAADLVVMATGLQIEIFGDIPVHVDGTMINPSERYCYKGMMINGVPNMAFSIGYSNASWTLKSDLVGEYVCRLLRHLERSGYDYCVPELPDEPIGDEPLMAFTSGYIERARANMPKQGDRKPWKLYQNYFLDRLTLGWGRVTDRAMRFCHKSEPSS